MSLASLQALFPPGSAPLGLLGGSARGAAGSGSAPFKSLTAGLSGFHLLEATLPDATQLPAAAMMSKTTHTVLT